jgi:hypothetical protein
MVIWRAFRDRLDVPQHNISFSALDPADVGAVEVAFRGKLFLRKIGPLPEFTNPPAESLGDIAPPHHRAET